MEPELRAFIDRFGGHLVREQYSQASDCLASWAGGGDLTSAIEAQMERTRGMMEDYQIGPPDGMEVDRNRMNADELRDEGVDLPSQITADNFEGWCLIQVQAGGGEYNWYDLWFAVVNDGGERCVGYFEVLDPD